MDERDWDLRGDVLAAESIAAGEPTAWFDRLYAEGESGSIGMPWDRKAPNPLLAAWADRERVDGAGRRAVVVGCGLGADAELAASLGFETTAFDVSPTAVRLAQERHPGTSVDYRVANLLDLPTDWVGAYDLVIEVFTVQALPDPPRTAAVQAVRSLLADGGTLLVVAFRLTEADDPLVGPPFPLPRSTIQAFGEGLQTLLVQEAAGPLWCAAFQGHAKPSTGR